MKFVEQTYNFSRFGSDSFIGKVFVFCQFRNVDFEESCWKDCLFIDCDFSLASFSKAKFDRCIFKACDFVFTHLDESTFKECHAILSNFESVRFGNCKFDFLSTDRCDFSRAKFTSYDGLPGESREIIGEIVRQAGDHPQIIGFSGMIKNNRELCWELMTKMGKEFISDEKALADVVQALKKVPNYNKLLNRFYDK